MQTVKVDFRFAKVGDTVTRSLGLSGPTMQLKITALDDKFIYCGSWKFDRFAGFEVDEDIGWGVPSADGVIRSGSFLLDIS